MASPHCSCIKTLACLLSWSSDLAGIVGNVGVRVVFSLGQGRNPPPSGEARFSVCAESIFLLGETAAREFLLFRWAQEALEVQNGTTI